MAYLQLILHDLEVNAVLGKLVELGARVTVIATPEVITTPPAAPVEYVDRLVHALPAAPFRVRTLRPVEVFGGPSTSSGARLRMLPEGNESMVVRQVWLKVSDAPELWVAYDPEALAVVE
jgi:hypothetical protein